MAWIFKGFFGLVAMRRTPWMMGDLMELERTNGDCRKLKTNIIEPHAHPLTKDPLTGNLTLKQGKTQFVEEEILHSNFIHNHGLNYMKTMALLL